MDAEAFALARNVQLKQLVNSFPHAGVDTAQAKWILESIDDDSATPYLAAVILLLKTAAPDAVAAACSNMTDRAALLAFARHTADTNNRQALLFFNSNAAPNPVNNVTPAPEPLPQPRQKRQKMSDEEAREKKSQRERAKRAAAAALRPDKPPPLSAEEIKVRHRERMAAKRLLTKQQLEQQQIVRDGHMLISE